MQLKPITCALEGWQQALPFILILSTAVIHFDASAFCTRGEVTSYVFIYYIFR